MENQKIGNGLQVTDIGTSALPMVGYLGKDCSPEASPDECCPSCKKKGLIWSLRTYRINFKESIFLCENPQCIYPLGFEPLSNIITPIDPKGYQSQETNRKRKFFITNPVTPSVEPHSKLSRTDNSIDDKQTLTPNLIPKCNGSHLFETPLGQPDVSEAHQPDIYNTAEPMEMQMALEMAATENLPGMSSLETQLLSGPESGSSLSQTLPQDKQPLPEQLWLQWRNVHALCWLDCILSALVHLETLKRLHSESIAESTCIFQRLFTKYNQAIALVNNCQRGEAISEIPSEGLSKAELHLNEIRNIIFVQLQPQLKCKLGEEESPVFAFPLLLCKDSKIENCFLHSFSWNFECLQCGHQVIDRCQKVLTTFTNIIPEWHPLNAVHIASCDNCNHKSQKRKMVLENVSSVLMMHFVEGLPHNNLTAYSFQFQNDFYQVKAVIQYQTSGRHFITWVLNSDETWLECDDLKGLYCRRHKSFTVPPEEIHIVIWERLAPQRTNDRDLELQSKESMNIPLLKEHPKSPLKNLNNKHLKNHSFISHCEDRLGTNINKAQTLEGNNQSNLLWGLENLADDDVITLTLVSVPLDSEGKPLEESHIEESLLANAGTPQLQDVGQVNMLPFTSEENISHNESILPEHRTVPLHQELPGNESNLFIMPTVLLSNSSNLQTALPVQEAEPEANLVPVKDSGLVNAKNEATKTKSNNTCQRAPNTLEKKRKITGHCHVPASSNSSQSPPKNGMKSANWVKTLLGRCPSVPKSASVFIKEETSSKKPTLSGRHALHFRGFETKFSRKLAKQDSPPTNLLPPSATSLSHPTIKKHAAVGSDGTVTNKSGSWVTLNKQIQPNQNCNENKKTISLKNGKLVVDQTQQLRFELLQQLKAKKEKLASLDKLAKSQVRKKRSKKTEKNQSQPGSQKEGDSLQRLLNDLQRQIDVEDSKSVNSPATTVSQCSSSSYDDILSELLSPATTVASLELPHEEECRYLEMGGGSPISSISNENPDEIIGHDHNYHTPEKQNGVEDQTDLLAVRSPLKKLEFGNPEKQDFLDDLFPSSMLNSIMADVEDLHNFDETLLTL
ncbi:SUMO-specific isopeptidase USPL1 isoform X1 [Anolis carolinensis]|uniref:SUMO-specific isopeptidase USPL1 isoform X1 n=2 Tax=Anolis carolinensis TaxID=28377 RepID=UPI002F2B476D